MPTRKAGISFDARTHERLMAVVGDGHLSPLVDALCWQGLEINAELARRGIHIDDHRKRTEFVLDRLEDGLDAWDG